jgi:TRAP-type uncharacterized transport system fused permease subunit
MSTAIEACKIGFAGFVVPFIFAYNPAMLLQGDITEILLVTFTALCGVIAMSLPSRMVFDQNRMLPPNPLVYRFGHGCSGQP